MAGVTNNRNNVFRLWFLTIVGFVLVLIPISLMLLWSYCFDSHTNQADRVKMFTSYFPEFLSGRYTLTFVGLLFSFLSVILVLIDWRKKTSVLKTISVVTLVAGGIMMMLYLFGLM